FEKPLCGFDLTLEQGTVEGALEIPPSKFGDRFDDFQPAEIGGVAHGRAPITAPDRHMEQLRIFAEHPNDRVTVIGVNGSLQEVCERVRINALLQFRPVGKAVFASDHQLSVAQPESCRAECLIVLVAESRMLPANSVECFGVCRAPFFEEFARLTFGNVEM